MISEELFYSLKAGDKIKIVDKWPPNHEAHDVLSMNKWLGKVVTVRKTMIADNWGNPVYLRIHEDKQDDGGWYWNRYCIDEVLTCYSAVGLEELI